MGHIHEGFGEFDQTVTAYIMRIGRGGGHPQILLHQHKKLGVLMPVGGHVELDETPWRAVLREIREESGYTSEQLQVMQPKIRFMGGATLSHEVNHPLPYYLQSYPSERPGHPHTDMGFLFSTYEKPTLACADGESSDLRWFGQKALERLSVREVLSDARSYALHAMQDLLPEYESVPAADYALDVTLAARVDIPLV